MVLALGPLLSHVSRHFSLEEGDLVLTGTPDGVGEVRAGDTVTAGIGDSGGDLVTITFHVTTNDMKICS